MDTVCTPEAIRAPTASPRSVTTVSVVFSARIFVNRAAAPGSVGLASQVTFSCRAARTASHSRGAVTAMKSPLRQTRAPAMPAIEASSRLSTLAPAP